MARRYGGQFSPGAQDAPANEAVPPPRAAPLKGAKPAKAAMRSNLLFIAPLVFLVPAFTSPPLAMVTWLAALAAMLLGAWLTRDGLRAEDAFDARKVARRPAIPRKIFGSVCVGAGLALAGLAGQGPLAAVLFGLLGAGLHFAAFGPDPMRDKGLEGVDRHQQDRVALAIDAAEDTLDALQAAVARTRDKALHTRATAFCGTARDLFRTVEEDPRDLSAARRYLGVYLTGARDAAVKYADLVTGAPNPQARADFIALLDDLDSNFAARRQKLLSNDRSALDVEISVLRERLAREGVRHDT